MKHSFVSIQSPEISFIPGEKVKYQNDYLPRTGIVQCQLSEYTYSVKFENEMMLQMVFANRIVSLEQTLCSNPTALARETCS